jgi:hypothetical protein
MCCIDQVAESSIFVDVYINNIHKEHTDQGYGVLCVKCMDRCSVCDCCERQTEPYADIYICTKCPTDQQITCSMCNSYHNNVTDC